MKGCIVLKIKNSSNAVSPDAAIIIMCFGILISCPLRIFLMLKNTDTVTGFYEDYGNIGVYALYGVLALVTVLVLLLTYLSGRIPASAPLPWNQAPPLPSPRPSPLPAAAACGKARPGTSPCP